MFPKCERDADHLRDRSTHRLLTRKTFPLACSRSSSASVIWSASRLFVFMQQANRFPLWNLLICIQTKHLIHTDPTSITQTDPTEST